MKLKGHFILVQKVWKSMHILLITRIFPWNFCKPSYSLGGENEKKLGSFLRSRWWWHLYPSLSVWDQISNHYPLCPGELQFSVWRKANTDAKEKRLNKSSVALNFNWTCQQKVTRYLHMHEHLHALPRKGKAQKRQTQEHPWPGFEISFLTKRNQCFPKWALIPGWGVQGAYEMNLGPLVISDSHGQQRLPCHVSKEVLRCQPEGVPRVGRKTLPPTLGDFYFLSWEVMFLKQFTKSLI